MSDEESWAFGDYPVGRRLEGPDSTSFEIGGLLRADERSLAFARRFFVEAPDGLEWRRRKVVDPATGEYFRFYRGDIKTAVSGGVSHYAVRDGRLILLRRPNSGQVVSQLVGEDLVGRRMGPHEPRGTVGFR